VNPLDLPPDVTPADILRAIVILRAEGDHAAADHLQAHLPPAHDPLPHLGESGLGGGPVEDFSPPNGGAGAREGQFAGGLPKAVPQPNNKASKGSMPPKIDKAYDWTPNPDAPSFPLTDTTAPNEPEPETKHKYGCVLLPLPEPARGRVLALGRMIPESDLAADGREDDIHATVLYGLHDDVAEADVFEVLSHFRPVRLKLGAVSVFANGEHDVIKIEVESDAIRRMNNALRRLPYTSKWSEYKPHVTIAYVKPGLGALYALRFGQLGAKVTCPTAVYSTVDATKHVYPLGRTITVEKSAMSYLAGDAGGALVGPAGGKRKRIKLKRNRSALAKLCLKALDEVGGAAPTFLPADPEAFIFGDSKKKVSR
jgi:2'-5' RNA ligase